MSKLLALGSTEAKKAVASLLDDYPVLIEVRFPKMGTSPDWYLCNDEDEFAEVTNKLGAGVELYLSSVWDLENPKGKACLIKQPEER